MKKVLVCLLVTFLLSSCRSSSGGGEGSVYKWESARKTEGLFDRPATCRYVLLENDAGAGPLGAIAKITYSKGKYYVLNGSRTIRKLSVFDDAGTCIGTIDRRGRGQGEYLSMSDFSVRNDTIFVLDNQRDMLHAYDAAGRSLGSRPLGIALPTAITATDYGFLLHRRKYDAAVDAAGEYAVYYLDHALQLFDRAHPYNADAPQIGYDAPFVETEDFVVFNQMFDGTVRVFDRHRPGERTYRIDFGGSEIPAKMRSDPAAVFEHKERYAFLASAPLLLGEHIVGQLLDRGKRANYDLNTRTGAIRRSDGGDLPLLYYFSQRDTTTAITWLDNATYGQLDRKPALPPECTDHLRNDGIVLMLVEI